MCTCDPAGRTLKPRRVALSGHAVLSMCAIDVGLADLKAYAAPSCD